MWCNREGTPAIDDRFRHFALDCLLGPLRPELRNDAREVFRITVAQQETMLRKCLYLSHEDHERELIELVRAGVRALGVDEAELDGVVRKCVTLVMRK